MRISLVTIVHGRHEHLHQQLAGITRAGRGPDEHVIVAMGDPTVRTLVAGSAPNAQVLDVDVGASGELPLAAARNAGAAAAIASGTDLLVFLDVDCIPGPELFSWYLRAAIDPAHSDAILCGPVSYLPARPESGYDLARLRSTASPHPGRPAPAPGQVLLARDRRLFWSLSFAVTVTTWARIGGFHTGYLGYGGEDTDFAEQAQAAGVGLRWVGGADTYHQHHPVSTPPTEHLHAIVRNARVFHERWGWWPMGGWLDAFAERGLVDHDAVDGWRVTTRSPS